MAVRRIVGLVSSTACTTCLAIGYSAAGYIAALAAVMIAFSVWLLAWRRPSTGGASAALILSVGLAACGVIVQAGPVPMILGAALALASWDSLLLDEILVGSPASPSVERLVRKHYASLMLALAIGVSAALTGRMIHIQVPFAGMMALGILAMLGLDRVQRILLSRHQP